MKLTRDEAIEMLRCQAIIRGGEAKIACEMGKDALERLGEIEDIVNSWEKTNNADDTINHFYAIREVIRRKDQ